MTFKAHAITYNFKLKQFILKYIQMKLLFSRIYFKKRKFSY